jgi:hypothetical protein
LVAIDKFSKWVEVRPITNLRAEQAVTFFTDIVHRFGVPNSIITDNGCCGDSRSRRAQTMRENQSSRTRTNTQDKRQPKVLFSTVDFSKADPLYKCRSVSFYREAGGLFTFREHPRVKRIKTECARLSSGNLQLGLHVIGAS